MSKNSGQSYTKRKEIMRFASILKVLNEKFIILTGENCRIGKRKIALKVY